MCKSWAKVVRSQRKASGLGIHTTHPQLWTNESNGHLSPTISTSQTTLCTQIVHKQVDKTTEVNRHFSAKSTAPITTTTIYINI